MDRKSAVGALGKPKFAHSIPDLVTKQKCNKCALEQMKIINEYKHLGGPGNTKTDLF